MAVIEPVVQSIGFLVIGHLAADTISLGFSFREAAHSKQLLRFIRRIDFRQNRNLNVRLEV
jgi:hypothetical protein